jgi:ribosomal protein S18 acetylase RimI-like enzyme
MQRGRYYEIAFRQVCPADFKLLEKWYGMTDQFGYATGLKSFDEIKVRMVASDFPGNASMIMLNGRERPVGFVFSEMKHSHQKQVLWINIIIVDPDFQGQGLGTCAINKMLAMAQNRSDAKAALVSVSERNSRGLSFFEKLGFVRCKSLEDSLSAFGPNDVAIMKRLIK